MQRNVQYCKDITDYSCYNDDRLYHRKLTKTNMYDGNERCISVPFKILPRIAVLSFNNNGTLFNLTMVSEHRVSIICFCVISIVGTNAPFPLKLIFAKTLDNQSWRWKSCLESLVALTRWNIYPISRIWNNFIATAMPALKQLKKKYSFKLLLSTYVCYFFLTISLHLRSN